MCYDSDFGLSEDELSWEEVKEVHAYKGQWVFQPVEVATLSRAVIYDQAARGWWL